MQETRAATIIQARVRGNRWRRQWQRCLRGITKLQARQRGRYSRREYELLRQLYRDQEAFQLETKRRELRIWRNEQELYFLRRTTSEALARIRDFQQRRSARLIQRQWLQSHQTDATKRAAQRVIDPRDRVLTFDPFLLSRTGDATSRASDKPKVNLMGPLLSTDNVGAVLAMNSEEFAARRLAIQERVKAKMKAKKAAEAAAALKQNFRDVASARTSTNKALSRRELCDTLRNLNAHTANRLAVHKASYREQQPTKVRAQSELLASCNNRLAHLLAEKPPTASGTAPDIDAASMDRWDPSRKRQAWKQHRAVVDSVVKKQHWWETYVAGQVRDIRKTYALSPWEPGQKKVWAWPLRPGDVDPVISSDSQAFESEGIRTFLFGEATALEPLDDHEASLWWRAHCTQSHLTKENASRAANNVEEEVAKWTPEQLANPLLFRLMANSKLRRREQELEHEIVQRVGRFDKRVQRGVNEIEMQIEVNTKLEQDLEQRKRDRIARKTREQAAAIAIQRHARGRRGRVKARETRAEFFVMVRGRAIRKGRCEECGEQRAVLECSECQDSTHFCPVCWVHVHSTRRRKTHVAMPMTMPVPSVQSTTPAATNLMKSELSVARSETINQDVGSRTVKSGDAVRQKAKTAVPLRRSRLVDPDVQPLAPLSLEQTVPPADAGTGGSVERAGGAAVADGSRVVNDAGTGGAQTRVASKHPPPTKGDAAADQEELKPRSTADSTEAPLSPPSVTAVTPVAPDAAEWIAAPIAHAQAGEGKGDAVETAPSEVATLVTEAAGDTVTSPPSRVASKSVRTKEGDISSAAGEVQPIPRSDTVATSVPAAEIADVVAPDSADGSQSKAATTAISTATVPIEPEPASSATGPVVSTGKKKPPPTKTAGRVSLKDRTKAGAVAKTSMTPAVDEQTTEAAGAATGDASGGTGSETAEPAGPGDSRVT